ncbi:hypothetical protein ACJX0J_035654, partial [Zea mays]
IGTNNDTSGHNLETTNNRIVCHKNISKIDSSKSQKSHTSNLIRLVYALILTRNALYPRSFERFLICVVFQYNKTDITKYHNIVSKLALTTSSNHKGKKKEFEADMYEHKKEYPIIFPNIVIFKELVEMGGNIKNNQIYDIVGGFREKPDQQETVLFWSLVFCVEFSPHHTIIFLFVSIGHRTICWVLNYKKYLA